MRLVRWSIIASVSLAALAVAPAALAQTPAYAPPHTSWGAPDLQGYWTNASITRLTRPPGVAGLVLTPEQAKALEDRDFNNARTKAELKPTDQSTGAPEKGKPLPGVGNYNAVWVDPGSKVAVVNGELRSSWIVDPPNGRIPYKVSSSRVAAEPAAAPKPAAKPAAKSAAQPAAKTGGAKPFVDDVPAPRVDARADAAARSYEGPESRSLGERCILGFGGTGGPVLNNVLYNNTYQIVQSPQSVVLLTEMVHDARIIPIVADKSQARHNPEAIKPWLGDSVGWYEGDTLVVETRNVNPKQRGYVGPNGILTERFSRTEDGVILYRFEVDDPDQYTQVWRGEMPLRTASGSLYEYACHEGNYGLLGILAGARVQEKQGKSLVLTPDSE